MKITFVGHGYVGLVTAAVFAEFGNTVYVIGRDSEKINNLKKGILPIYEPGLEELVKKNYDAGRLIFTLDYKPAISESDIVFTAVGTPPKSTGEADLTNVLKVAEDIGKNLSGYTVIATKSTVPVGTNKRVMDIINKVKPSKSEFDMASCPEFLREGTAISDTMNPDRIVIGTENSRARKLLVDLHNPITGERVFTNLETAEMIKYASNSFLATKISFANAIARLSERAGADGPSVLEGIGMDSRIGKKFLSPGPGYGGSCFPKDVKALIAIADGYGYNFNLLKEVEAINKDSQEDIIRKAILVLGDVKDKKIGILGLAFKPNTDDMRDAPSIAIIKSLLAKGAKISAFDPESMGNAKKIMPDIQYVEDPYNVADKADLLIVVTDWNEFKEMDLARIRSIMKSPNLIDARNIYEAGKLIELGFTYRGVGR
ncbi:MAG: UDP-glucose/GDP-mannose dehydrogenase family protein [Candidatus Levybacteria bacterium]|nr:UDP-glucose/GDP-mannose dehydrogenase family protein [Candidatus Levybacteria bacterium]